MVPSSLAHKYAEAFLNASEDICYSSILAIEEAANVLYARRGNFSYIMASADLASLSQAINNFLHSYDIKGFLKPLVELLREHKRLSMLYEVLFAIVSLYKERFKIEKVLVESANTLSDDQIKLIEDYIKQKISENPDVRYAVKPDLIAGIRIQSETFLWEHSVQNELKELRLLLSGERYGN